MSDHGWPDGDQHHDGGEHEDFEPADDISGRLPEPVDHVDDDAWEMPDDEGQLSGWEHDAPPEHADEAAASWHDDPAGAGLDEPPVAEEPVDVFPPVVDVGPLPEPVDGFPWIDSSSLGLIDAGPISPVGADALAGTPEPQELAEYAAEELPPAVDPWAALAESEDPATAALAKFYRPDQT
jgi:hypothetical protein